MDRVSVSWSLLMQIPVGQKLLKSAGIPAAVLVLGFLQQQKLLGSSAEQVISNHCHSCCAADTDNPFRSSLLLAISVCLSFVGLCVSRNQSGSPCSAPGKKARKANNSS